MSTDNRHPAGTSIGGRWAPGSAAEIDLDDSWETSEVDSALARELESRGIDPGDCPDELARAWRENQEIIDAPTPSRESHILGVLGVDNPYYLREVTLETPETGGAEVELTVRDDGIIPIEGEEDLEESLRGGRGFLCEEGELGDDLHTTYHYKLDEGDAAAKLRQTPAIAHAAKQQEQARRVRDLVLDGRAGPWAEMADREAVLSAAGAADRERRRSLGEDDLERMTEKSQRIRDFDSAVLSGKTPDFSALAERGDVIASHQAQDIEDAVHEIEVARRDLAKQQGIVDEASTLPQDSDLRHYLLGERPERTYMRDENAGTRKRKKLVRRTYRPKPPLIDELESSQRGVDNALSSYNRAVEPLRRASEKLDREVAQSRESAEQAERYEEQLRTIGRPEMEGR